MGGSPSHRRRTAEAKQHERLQCEIWNLRCESAADRITSKASGTWQLVAVGGMLAMVVRHGMAQRDAEHEGRQLVFSCAHSSQVVVVRACGPRAQIEQGNKQYDTTRYDTIHTTRYILIGMQILDKYCDANTKQWKQWNGSGRV